VNFQHLQGMWYGMFMCERHRDIVFHFNFFLKVHSNLLFVY
jgi:hypothetical protein